MPGTAAALRASGCSRVPAPAIPRLEEDDADVAAASLVDDGRGDSAAGAHVDERAPGAGELEAYPRPDHPLVAGPEVVEALDPAEIDAGVDAGRLAEREGVARRGGQA